LGGLLLSSGGALIVFTITIGQGRFTAPGLFLAGSVGTLGVVAYLLVRTAQALVETGAVAEAREEKAATGRRRKELEREYNTLKRALKELELDYTMGKLSDQDYTQVRARYRERAVRILRQLDQGETYRAQIERDLQARLKAKGLHRRPAEGGAAKDASAQPTGEVRLDSSAATPKKAAAEADNTRPEPRILPPGYEPSIISEEPTKAAAGFAALMAGRTHAPAPVLAPGYEASIISEEPTKAAESLRAAAGQTQVHRDGMNFPDSATVMRAVAKLTGGNAVSTELTQQTAIPTMPAGTSAPDRQSDPGQLSLTACASCSAANDPDANFCKKCGTRLHP
jgi:hypothetical protein